MLLVLLLLARVVKLVWLLGILCCSERLERGPWMALRTDVLRLGCCCGLSLHLQQLLLLGYCQQGTVLQLAQLGGLQKGLWKLQELLLVDQCSLGAKDQ